MEAEQDQLLPGGLAGHGQRARHRRRHVHHLALPQERRVSPQNKLQPARSPVRGQYVLVESADDQ